MEQPAAEKCLEFPVTSAAARPTRATSRIVTFREEDFPGVTLHGLVEAKKSGLGGSGGGSGYR